MTRFVPSDSKLASVFAITAPSERSSMVTERLQVLRVSGASSYLRRYCRIRMCDVNAHADDCNVPRHLKVDSIRLVLVVAGPLELAKSRSIRAYAKITVTSVGICGRRIPAAVSWRTWSAFLVPQTRDRGPVSPEKYTYPESCTVSLPLAREGPTSPARN